jgi:glycosyltransferase involved in cell wall biosynthesis
VPEPALTPQLDGETAPDPTRPLLSVVVPVYNQAETIVENVRTIRDRVAAGIGEPIELIVVSDGSIDNSEGHLVEGASDLARVIHYDRNLGKGYAIKTGSLAATGRYISYVDADLDLDPAAIPRFLELAQSESLDFVIGSKRHRESRVEYPRSRQVGSWLYQQLVRLLFRLNVSDTQVGLKVFRREVAEEVLPLLLVKQYAFDLEFLAVARALGFGRIREQPVTLDYRFTGSGVRSAAVLLALIDTAAIFYRLRILRYYQRKRALLPEYARARNYRPSVTLVSAERAPAELDYPDLDVLLLVPDKPENRRKAVQSASGEVLAFLERGAAPAGNWLESTTAFLANPEIAAVVTASMTPAHGSLRERAAAAVAESHLGGGSHHFRFTPGNLRYVRQFPAANIVVRKDDLVGLDEGSLHPDRLCAALNERGRRVLYSPETVVVTPRAPLFRPHLELVAAAGRARGDEIQSHGLRGITAASLPPLALLTFVVSGWPLALAGGTWRLAWLLLWAAYTAAIMTVGTLAALRFHSLRVGALAGIGTVAVHLTYAVGVVRGVLRPSRV